MLDIENIVQKYAYHPIKSLPNNESFIQDICGTGENQSKFLVRRFSFRKPRLSIRVDNPALAHVDMVYGLNNRTTILSVEREVITNDKDEPICLYVKDENKELSTLEESLSSLFDIKGWKFPSDIRSKKIGEFLTKESPYSFDMRISVDTLSVYGEVTISVILDYIDFNDAIKLIKRNDPEIVEELDVCYNIKESSVSPLAIQYRDYVANQPHIQTDND